MLRAGTIGEAPAGRAYYVGGIDPRTGEVCRERLALGDIYHLVELAPDEGLTRGLRAAGLVQAALATGALAGRSDRCITAWIEGLPHGRKGQARQAISDLLTFLKGETLEQAEEVYREAYRRQLKDGRAHAAVAWLCLEQSLGLDVEILDAGEGLTAQLVCERVRSLHHSVPSSPLAAETAQQEKGEETRCLSIK